MSKSSKKVCDYEIDWDSGLFTCCADEIMNNEGPALPGDQIECDSCGATMVLQEKNGVLMWRGQK